MDGTNTVIPHEQILVAQAKADPAAFAALYEHYLKRVYNYMRYRLDDAATADDLTAQVFQRALATLSGYEAQRAPFGAWLFGIAHHVINDHFRWQKRRQWLSLDVLRRRPSLEPQPEEAATQREGHTAVLKAMACLTERERDIIALKFAAGLNNRQIAAQLDLSAGNVGVILYRAMRQLKAAMIEQEIIK
jgi:RNA polymerase sigma-70 factor, ECF subfamily